MIDLGDKVEHKVSGFIGIAVSKHIYIDGFVNINVQPECKKNDLETLLPKAETFSERELRVVAEKYVTIVI